MLADDLGRISFESFGSEVPTRDVPCRIEHKNGIVLYVLDQLKQPLSRLALEKLVASTSRGHFRN
jgi:hypothetical protein